MSAQLLVLLLSSLGTILLGLFTYYKNPNSATNRLLFIFTLTLSAYNLVNFLATNQADSGSTFLYVKAIMIIALFINLLFFLLASAFPQQSLKISPLHLTLYLTLTFVITILTLTNLVFSSVTLTPTGTNSNPGPAMPLFLLHTIGFLGLGFYNLIKKYKKASGNEKVQLKFLFMGTIFMFAAILISNLFIVIIFNVTSQLQLLPLYTFFFIGFISYAVIKHRFLDIGLVVFRTVSFTLLTIIITIIYASSLFTFTRFSNRTNSTVLSIILAIVLVYTYNPLRRLIEKLTKNIFYKEPYSPEQLLENLGKIIRSTLNLHTLTRKVLDELTTTMKVSRAVFLINTKNDHYLKRQVGFNDVPNYSPNTIHNLTKAAENNLLIFDLLEESPTKMLLRQHNISVVVPLTVKNTHHGLLLLGEKSSGEIYSQQDIDVLEILMPQLSVAIQNAKSYDEIKHFADTLKDEVDIATADLKKANKELRHLDKLKDEFVFIATHELKNPVTAMKGYLSMIDEGIFGDIPKKLKDPLKELGVSNQQLVQLVNDLLQIARSEAKTLTIDTNKIDLCPLIEAILGNLKPLYEQKKLKVEHIYSHKNLHVMSDESKLKEVINNLVSNAIKYSDSGTISITHEVKDGMVTTHVKDQGVGISQKDQQHIFSRFFRAEEEAAKGIPGTGLGLFIVKQLVHKMHGKIWFESTKGVGTTFSFSLPLAN